MKACEVYECVRMCDELYKCVYMFSWYLYTRLSKGKVGGKL